MVYRLSALTGIVTSLFHFLVEVVLWKTLLGAGIRSGTSMRDMLGYIMINGFVLSLTSSNMANTLGGEIQDGSVAMHLQEFQIRKNGQMRLSPAPPSV
jgi:ABC-type uncharacterized transport system permease subunit